MNGKTYEKWEFTSNHLQRMSDGDTVSVVCSTKNEALSLRAMVSTFNAKIRQEGKMMTCKTIEKSQDVATLEISVIEIDANSCAQAVSDIDN